MCKLLDAYISLRINKVYSYTVFTGELSLFTSYWSDHHFLAHWRVLFSFTAIALFLSYEYTVFFCELEKWNFFMFMDLVWYLTFSLLENRDNRWAVFTQHCTLDNNVMSILWSQSDANSHWKVIQCPTAMSSQLFKVFHVDFVTFTSQIKKLYSSVVMTYSTFVGTKILYFPYSIFSMM